VKFVYFVTWYTVCNLVVDITARAIRYINMDPKFNLQIIS